MTTDSELIALVERCEAATGADREIDIEILRHVDPERLEWMNSQYAKSVSKLMARGPDAWEARMEALYRHCYTPKAYTASLDAAMTLIDPEAFWQVGNDGEGPDPSMIKARVSSWKNDEMAFHVSVAETAPLALTAASLRARATMGGAA